MAAYSGIGINDLGNYSGCKDIDIARYVLLLPQDSACLALCGPKSCGINEYQELIDSATDLLATSNNETSFPVI